MDQEVNEPQVQEMVGEEEIETFLQGKDPQKYITFIEVPNWSNKAYVVVRTENGGKRMEEHSFEPFVWVKPEVRNYMFQNCSSESEKDKIISEKKRQYGITLKNLKTKEEHQEEGPSKLENGYKTLVKSNQSFKALKGFFEEAGVNIFSNEHKDLFMRCSTVEQFMIQTGKRLFKGFEDYNDLKRVQFDLETTGIDPRESSIFQIGIRCNDGTEEVLNIKGDTPKERRDNEIQQIQNFFKILSVLDPDIIAGYNSENFDWEFIEGRCDRLHLNIKEMVKNIMGVPFYRTDSFVKIGQETEDFRQTNIPNYNILDVSHATRKAQAINTDIKSWKLEYITKFAEIEKKNRVYVPGDKIYETWADTENSYAFNEENGDWYKITEENPIQQGYEIVSGEYIVDRYLKDDLWETEKVDEAYSQATFLMGKMIPTTYQKNATMGTASTWKLIMMAWSYENGLAIPQLEKKKKFPGGLSRLLRVGRSTNIVKLDYAALYPKTELTNDIFPDLDVSGVMKGLLKYIVETRDESKDLKGKYKKKKEELEEELESKKDQLSQEEVDEYKKKIKENRNISDDYDKKQMPLKILANSFFGAFGAPYIFPWGDTKCASETTCRGRQYLRLMVWFFTEVKGFTPLVGDSVTKDMPVYIKYNDSGKVDIVPIRSIFEETTVKTGEGQERDFSEKNYKILTKNGWKPINYVYRHKTNKQIHKVFTRDRLIECTSDHSLFSDEKEAKPSDLKRGNKIDTYDVDLPNELEDMTNDEAWLLGFFIADGSSVYKDRKIKKYFSKKKNKLVEHNGKRGEWTISNQDRNKLKEAQKVVEGVFGIEARIKDYSKSSNCLKLKTSCTSISKWFSENCYDNNRNKKIPYKLLNASHELKKSFMNGFITGDGWGDNLDECKNITQKHVTVMAGINLILKELGYDFTLKLRKDKQNIIAFNLGEKYGVNNDKSFRETDKVWGNEEIDNVEDYVYDVSADGTFICGVGGFIAHNTDGYNFSMPGNIEEMTYVPKGTHNFTKDDEGKTLTGLDAVVAEFNELYMEGYMGLDVDEIADAEINFSRKNYATLIGDEMHLTGNTIKSNILPDYIKEFIDEGIELLLRGKGYEFIQKYYQKVDDIFNYRVPLSKIASKSKVKLTKEGYREYLKQTQKNGRPMSRQAHMELALRHDLDINLGDVIYYVNVGTAKSHGDTSTKKVINEETGEEEEQLMCEYIPNETIENNPEKTFDRYNVPRYLSAFNDRVEPLLVCFSPEIRDQILVGVKKDRKTKEYILEEKKEFTKKGCEFVTGYPLKEDDQDDYHKDLMLMEDQEIEFWISVGKTPNHIKEEDWEAQKNDYLKRKEEEKRKGLEKEREQFIDYLQRMEIDGGFKKIETDNELPKEIERLGHPITGGDVISHKWGEKIGNIKEKDEYKDEAKERKQFYENNWHWIKKARDRYEVWLDYKFRRKVEGRDGDRRERTRNNGDIHESSNIDYLGLLPTLTMQHYNIEKIRNGEKTATSRTKKLDNGLYKLDGNTVIKIKGSYYSNIEKMEKPNKWAKAEGYKTLKNLIKNTPFDHVAQFAKGERDMYVYVIEEVIKLDEEENQYT